MDKDKENLNKACSKSKDQERCSLSRQNIKTKMTLREQNETGITHDLTLTKATKDEVRSLNWEEASSKPSACAASEKAR
jgi:hypothetical protein